MCVQSALTLAGIGLKIIDGVNANKTTKAEAATVTNKPASLAKRRQ